MMGFEKNGNSVRVQHGFESICDLLADALLHRKSFRKKAHHAGALSGPFSAPPAYGVHARFGGNIAP